MEWADGGRTEHLRHVLERQRQASVCIGGIDQFSPCMSPCLSLKGWARPTRAAAHRSRAPGTVSCAPGARTCGQREATLSQIASCTERRRAGSPGERSGPERRSVRSPGHEEVGHRGREVQGRARAARARAGAHEPEELHPGAAGAGAWRARAVVRWGSARRAGGGGLQERRTVRRDAPPPDLKVLEDGLEWHLQQPPPCATPTAHNMTPAVGRLRENKLERRRRGDPSSRAFHRVGAGSECAPEHRERVGLPLGTTGGGPRFTGGSARGLRRLRGARGALPAGPGRWGVDPRVGSPPSTRACTPPSVRSKQESTSSFGSILCGLIYAVRGVRWRRRALAAGQVGSGGHRAHGRGGRRSRPEGVRRRTETRLERPEGARSVQENDKVPFRQELPASVSVRHRLSSAAAAAADAQKRHGTGSENWRSVSGDGFALCGDGAPGPCAEVVYEADASPLQRNGRAPAQPWAGTGVAGLSHWRRHQSSRTTEAALWEARRSP